MGAAHDEGFVAGRPREGPGRVQRAVGRRPALRPLDIQPRRRGCRDRRDMGLRGRRPGGPGRLALARSRRAPEPVEPRARAGRGIPCGERGRCMAARPEALAAGAVDGRGHGAPRPPGQPCERLHAGARPAMLLASDDGGESGGEAGRAAARGMPFHGSSAGDAAGPLMSPPRQALFPASVTSWRVSLSGPVAPPVRAFSAVPSGTFRAEHRFRGGASSAPPSSHPVRFPAHADP